MFRKQDHRLQLLHSSLYPPGIGYAHFSFRHTDYMSTSVRYTPCTGGHVPSLSGYGHGIPLFGLVGECTDVEVAGTMFGTPVRDDDSRVEIL
jgi:hypothetical protein